MKNASIVSIGNEILHGQTLDTNASYLSGRLLSIGIPVVSWHASADEADLISRTLRLATEDADIVIVTGGLGPTDDDVTREGLAKFLSVDSGISQGTSGENRSVFFIEKYGDAFEQQGAGVFTGWGTGD